MQSESFLETRTIYQDFQEQGMQWHILRSAKLRNNLRASKKALQGRNLGSSVWTELE